MTTVRHVQLKIIFMILGVLSLSLPALAKKAPEPLPFAKGETITYTIKKMGFKAGETILVFEGAVEVEKQAVYLIHSKADGANFFDEEKIYLDQKTFLPVRVERDVNVFGKKEKIVEHYDQKKYEVKIVKTAKGKTKEQVIKKDRPMENLYGFIYRYRKEGKFTIGDALQMNLPTADVKLKLVKKDKIKVGGVGRRPTEQEAYYMESNPAKYKVWFDGTDRKVPLRIDGAVGFGSTSMTMKDYSQGKSQ